MAHKLFSLVLMLVLALPVVLFAFAGDETKSPMSAEIMQKQIADAIKVYGEKKEIYKKDVLDLFERKEKNARDKGDLKTISLIKKEKDAFFENGKDPTLFFVTDQKRSLELAKLDLIKAYEKTIKDCLKMKLDVEAEGFSKELEEIRAGQIKTEIKVEEKNDPKKDDNAAWLKLVGIYRPVGKDLRELELALVQGIPRIRRGGWSNEKDWAYSKGKWLFGFGNIDLFTIEPAGPGKVKWSIYWKGCEKGFPTTLPQGPPNYVEILIKRS